MLNLVPETNSILKTRIMDFDLSNPCTDPDKLSKNMIKFMLKHNGVGLAAPQLGLSYRVFVMGEENNTLTCFNPTIIETSEDFDKIEEGCLSFPGLYIKIKRPKSLVVEFQDKNGKVHTDTLYSIWARCFHHELDHLNGTVFTSRAGGTALSLARSRRKKHLRRMAI